MQVHSSLKLGVSARALFLFSLAFTFHHADLAGQAFASGDEILIEGKKSVFLGPFGREAVEKATAPAKIPKLFEEFEMKPEGHWGFKKNPVSFAEGITRFHFSIFREESTEPAPAPEPGLWGAVSGLFSSAVKSVVQRVNKELIGNVTREKVQCQAPFDPQGYQFKIDLAESSYSIQAVTTQVTVNFCVRDSSLGKDQEGIIMAHSVGLVPGELFPGVENEKFQKFMTQISENLHRMLEDKIQREQVVLIQQKFTDEDAAAIRK